MNFDTMSKKKDKKRKPTEAKSPKKISEYLSKEFSGTGEETHQHKRQKQNGVLEESLKRLESALTFSNGTTSTSTAAFTSTANFIDMEFAQAASVSISRQQQLIWGLNYAYERKEFHLMLPLTNTKSISLFGCTIDAIIVKAKYEDGSDMNHMVAISILAKWLVRQGCW